MIQVAVLANVDSGKSYRLSLNVSNIGRYAFNQAKIYHENMSVYQIYIYTYIILYIITIFLFLLYAKQYKKFMQC